METSRVRRAQVASSDKRVTILAIAVALLLTSAAPAEVREGILYAPSLWDLQLRSHATELPKDEFIDYACGTRGGPPSIALADWTEYKKCRPEPNTGFREVYFRYDNEPEYIAKARDLPNQVAIYQYTSAYAIPIIASALFDADGFMIGFRIVADPRVDARLREKGVTLAGYLMGRYDRAPWACDELPRVEGEREFMALFVKRRCVQRDGEADLDLVVESHNLRKAGQFAVNPADGLPMDGQFESSTFFEAVVAGGIPDRQARLAALPARSPTEKELLVLRASDCPGCDLSRANLKRANLAGANLAGANLAGANLHGAVLTGANLVGANLENANVNRADVRGGNLRNANLSGAMLFEARFDGADLSSAILSQAMAGRIQLSGAKAGNAILDHTDLRGARMNDAYLGGADLSSAWMNEALLLRSNLTGAKVVKSLILWANMTQANLSGTDFSGSDLYGANLREADLRGADFSDARLTSVNLTGVQSTGAKFLGSLLPDGFAP